jgi:hypothetical protein
MGLIVFNARGAKWPHSHDELVRLLDHRLIALTASSSRAVKERLRDILVRQDPSCVREALEVVAQVLVEKEADAFRRSPAPPFAVGDQSYALLESTVVGFPNDFLREGLSPQAFLEKDLRLIGVDCSPKDPPPSGEVSRPETAPPKRQPAQEARPGGGTSEVLPGGRG